jgi:YHS domain-containing protein
MAKHTDPICGMQVEEESAAGAAEYGGRSYYFCSGGCREKFYEDPSKYIALQGRGGPRDDGALPAGR